jgi:pimeloyl-ACP methyl ester carboxylesterase
MPKIQINNLTLNYLDQGQGPILLILHGWGSSLESYKQLIPLLTDKFRVIMPELPGFGESTEPKEAWSLDEYVNFIKSFVETHNCVPLHLYAHSFGGRIAIKWLSEDESAVRKLIMCGAAGIKDQSSFRQSLASQLSNLKKLIPHFLRKPLQKVLYKLAGSNDYEKASPIMKETLKKVVAEDLTSLLSKITKPTLLIWGKHDTYTPLKHGHIMNEKIKNSELVIMEGVRHGVHLQAPEKLATLIKDFLGISH